MSNFTVTQLGKANLQGALKLTADVITLVDGTFDIAWTMQATYSGSEPVDKEGWAPWAGASDTNNIQGLIERGYIVEVHDAS